MRPKILFGISLITLITCFSCKNSLNKLMGIELLEEFNPALYQETVDFFTSNYSNTIPILSPDSTFSKYTEEFGKFRTNDLKQPIQILYFKQDSLISYHANCYVKSSWIGSLDWNYDGKLNSFIPLTSIPIQENKGLKYLVKNYSLNAILNENVIMFFWSNMLNCESKKAFNTIINNIKTSNLNQLPTIITINTDYTFIKYNNQ